MRGIQAGQVEQIQCSAVSKSQRTSYQIAPRFQMHRMVRVVASLALVALAAAGPYDKYEGGNWM